MINLQLHNKVVLITGSTKGIGFSIAKALHRENCKVVLNGRDPISVKEAVLRLPGAAGYSADVTKPEEAVRLVSKTIDRFGKLDALVCNVGSGKSVSPGKEY